MSNGFSAAELEEEVGLDDPLAAFLEERYEKALGEAADAKSGLEGEIDRKGTFWLYLEDSRREAIAAMADLATIDAGDVVSVRRIQTALLVYHSACGFAQKLIDGYSPAQSDSAAQAESGVGEPL